MKGFQYLLLSLGLILPGLVSGQNLPSVVMRIQNDTTYYWGISALHDSADEADREALAQLARSINVHLSGRTEIREHQYGSDYVNNVDTRFSATSFASLQNLQQNVIIENGKCIVFRYVKKREVRKALEQRGQKAIAYIDVARRAEAEKKYGQALKYYYWAWALTGTLQKPDALRYEGSVVRPFVQDRMTDILRGFKYSFDGFTSSGRTLGRIRVTFNDIPVSSSEFTYFDGISWSDPAGVRDGLGAIELRQDVPVDKIDIRTEYRYVNEAKSDPDLASIIEVITPLPLPDANVNGIPLTVTKAARKAAGPQQQVTATSSIASTYTPDRKKSREITRILDAIDSRKYEGIRDCFTTEGYEIFNELLRYGNARILARPEMNTMASGGLTYYRSVPMQFSFSGNRRQFMENVVFVADSTDKICAINFALEEDTVRDIVKTRWSDEAKMGIISFLENYQTAFALKRIDYIESIFSDDALIIVGRVVKKANIGNDLGRLGDKVEYQRYTKQEYIDRLKTGFRSKEYINLKFANIRISKADKNPEMENFGIEVKQDYFSSNYGDSGYLFLMVCMKDPQKPLIRIRTWQPQPDPDFGIYQIGDF